MDEYRYWWKEAKLYELYIDKFAGNLQGLTARLDYFTKLGVDTLHLLPHYPSPMVDQGYDIKDYQGVRPELGTLEDFKTLVEAAHARGLHIVTDFVLNHVSVEHPWFVEASASKDNPKRNFFLWSDTGSTLSDGINAFPDIKPSNWIFNPATSDYYYATFYPQQPDLNWDNSEVMEMMFANMDFWADMGVDGFRLDAACFLIKRDGTTCRGLPETHEVIKRIRKHLDERYPHGVILLGEAAQDIESTKTYFGNGDECHLMYHFPLMAQMWSALKNGDATPVRNMIERSFDIPQNCQWVVFLRNHDEIELRFLDASEEHQELLKFLDPEHAYSFNKGEGTSMRIGSIFHGDREKILSAFAMLYAMPGAPVMYYGDEIGLCNLPVEEGVIDTRLYVRGQFDWTIADMQMANPLSLLTRTISFIKSTPSKEVLPAKMAI